MGSENRIQDSRRNFLKGAGVAAAAYMLGAVSHAGAEVEKEEVTLTEYQARKQLAIELVILTLSLPVTKTPYRLKMNIQNMLDRSLLTLTGK